MSADRALALSTVDEGRPFALLGPGFCGGGFVLLRGLTLAGLEGARLVFVPYEGASVEPRGFSAASVERFGTLRCDVAPAIVAAEPEARGFAEAVEHIRERIAAGDVYQVNLTQRCRLGEQAGAALIARLCAREVPRFLAWVRLPDGTEFVSASPECFFEISGRCIRVEPMKGTSSRDAAAELDESGKDRAELAMITDLMRNDLTPLCVPRSVRVSSERRTVALAYAHQTVSEVEGVLRDDVTLADVLRGLHPGGSVTGAPKQAAIELISQLERSPRGPYCGTLAWREGPRTVASLLIRTAFREASGWSYGAGGGVTWRSTAAGEWAELQVKLGALR